MTFRAMFAVVAPMALSSLGLAQHLWWKVPDASAQYTCIYGEIRVEATNPTIYYCGCNWWPGAAAGGYTGIQDKGNGVHNMIFSIWDTSPDLHPAVTYAIPAATHSRFGGEGTGAHTDLVYPWQVGHTYQFMAMKRQDATGANTLTTVYFRDAEAKKWVKEATITSPNGTFPSVKTFGGSLAGFLENWSGQDRPAPKLALYRLWVGTSPADLVPVTSAGGDGKWGTLNGWFYLAEGDDAALEKVIQRVEKGNAYEAGPKSGAPLTIPAAKVKKKTESALEKVAGK